MSTNFNLNTLNGRLAEQLIQDLFINITPESNYTLGRVRSFHFSVENIQRNIQNMPVCCLVRLIPENKHEKFLE